jgi:hypothetical protein
VFLVYSSEKGAAFLDRALYLPRAWTNAPARRAEAGVPEERGFYQAYGPEETTVEELVGRARSAGPSRSASPKPK